MALTIYYDASGHETNDLFLSCVGVVAERERWSDFDRDWRAVLDLDGIKEFHHADFKASEREFKGWKGDESRRQRFMSALLDVMDRHITRWHSGGVYPRSFRSVAEDFALDEFAGPFMLAATMAKSGIEQWASMAVPGEPLRHIFERGDHGQTPCHRLEDLEGDVSVLRKYEQERGYIYGFQAADLIAGELTTLQAGIDAELDKFNRIGRVPLRRVFAIPGQIDNADAMLLRAACSRYPNLFPPR